MMCFPLLVNFYVRMCWVRFTIFDSTLLKCVFELKFELTSIYKQIHTHTHTHPYALTESLETHSQVRKDVDGSRKHMMEVIFLNSPSSHLNGIKEILKYLGHSSTGFEAWPKQGMVEEQRMEILIKQSCGPHRHRGQGSGDCSSAMCLWTTDRAEWRACDSGDL